MGIRLKYLGHVNICHGPEGLTEPSGLALAKDGKTLWTVSDDTRKVFRLDLDGRLIEGESFAVGQAGLEGVTLDDSGDFLYVAQEGGNRLTKYSLQTKRPVRSRPLSRLKGYRRIRGYFRSGNRNKGLEGITFNTHTGTLFLLKEGKPALLLEVSADLATCIGHRKLTKKRGFTDDAPAPGVIDCSGIAYDARRDAFWIVSDRARRIYLYSRQRDSVLFSRTLRYREGGKRRTVKKAEGVACDIRLDRLYIVSDREARLYRYAIR